MLTYFTIAKFVNIIKRLLDMQSLLKFREFLSERLMFFKQGIQLDDFYGRGAARSNKFNVLEPRHRDVGDAGLLLP